MAKLTLEFHTKSLARRTRLDLVIPSLNLGGSLKNQDNNYYQNRTEKFPLIIFLHGFGDDEKAWQNNTQVIKLCEENKIATDFLYGNFTCLSKDMPLFIAGVSMGGYGALYHYLKNTDKYAACVALSPAIRPDRLDESKFGFLRDLFLENKESKLEVYLSVGENDFIIESSKGLNQFLIENNVGVEYKFIPNCDHSWLTWAQEIFPVFEYLKNKIKGE